MTWELNEKKSIENAIERELKIKFGETSKYGKVTLKHVICHGMCDQSNVMLINSEVCTKLIRELVVKAKSQTKLKMFWSTSLELSNLVFI